MARQTTRLELLKQIAAVQGTLHAEREERDRLYGQVNELTKIRDRFAQERESLRSEVSLLRGYVQRVNQCDNAAVLQVSKVPPFSEPVGHEQHLNRHMDTTYSGK